MEKEIIEMNKKVVLFLGYIYHEQVDIDNSDIGGIYERTDVWSKVPIEINSYPEDDQYYLTTGWALDNENNYFLGELNYHSIWSDFMPAFFKFRDLEDEFEYESKAQFKHGVFLCRISDFITDGKDTTPLSACGELVKGVEWYNSIKK